MNFLSLKPEAKAKLAGFAIRVDDYLGIEEIQGMPNHKYAVTRVNRATGDEEGSAHKLSSIPPNELEVDENGMLVESVNALQRPRPDGAQPYIVRKGTKIVLSTEYTEWR